MQIEEVENLRVFQALDLQLRVGDCVGRNEGRRRNAEHVLCKLLFVHQLRAGHSHQLDADAHEADVIYVRRDVRARAREPHPCRSVAAARKCRGAVRRKIVVDNELSAHNAVCLCIAATLEGPRLPKRLASAVRKLVDDRSPHTLLRPATTFSSAIFKPSFGRARLIRAVTSRVSGSRSTASNAGRKKGSNRRSI